MASPLAVPPWTNQTALLYHGTLAAHVQSILKRIDLARCQPLKDFGRGFYTTTSLPQARTHADDLAKRSWPRSGPAVIEVTVDRDRLAGLECLFFVRCLPDASDYWSFVQHCRTSSVDHGRVYSGNGWYDVVVGPVTGAWAKQTTIPDSDQISFHTPAAVKVLNNSGKRQV